MTDAERLQALFEKAYLIISSATYWDGGGVGARDWAKAKEEWKEEYLAFVIVKPSNGVDKIN